MGGFARCGSMERGTAGNIILQLVAADFGGSGRRNAAAVLEEFLVVAATATTAMEAVVARGTKGLNIMDEK